MYDIRVLFISHLFQKFAKASYSISNHIFLFE